MSDATDVVEGRLTPGAHGAAAGPARLHVLLVTQSAAVAESVHAALAQAHPTASLERVGGYLMALGRLASGAPGPSPDVVIGCVEGLAGDGGSIVEGLRRLLPDAALVAVAPGDADAEAEAAVAAGFDCCVRAPLDPGRLKAALQGQDAQRPAALGDRVRALDRAVRRRLLGAGPSGEMPRVAERPAADLGDVDLVDRLLAGDQDLQPLAARVLRGHAHVPGLAWIEAADPVPAGHVSWPVEVAGTCRGRLHAPPPAEPAALASWAGWLSRWLALERRMDQLWSLALRDELTGAWNRRYLDNFLGSLLDRATQERFRVTVLVFDIDDFKVYNDRWGHAAGDQILRESARLMLTFVREHDVVARIGGDEFAVVFWDAEAPRRPHSEHPDTIRKAAERFRQAICQHRFPKLAEEAPGTLTISGGLAGYPWDGRTCEELLGRADEMALQSKRRGKGVITFGPGALETRSP